MVESAPHEQINHPIGAAMAAVAARIDIITLGLSIRKFSAYPLRSAVSSSAFRFSSRPAAIGRGSGLC
jgi:hypothetical protein